MKLKHRVRAILEFILPGRFFCTIQSIRSRNYQKQLVQEWGFVRAAHEFVCVQGHTVLNGPFIGMTYPRSSLFNRHSIPLLLGTYELEIQPVIEELISKPLEKIVVVGCAEGYYAVGLALRTNALVYAFDCEPRERLYCREMAHKNNVNERVNVQSWCDGRTLKDLVGTRRCLIISDCEGYEAELFSDDVVPALKRCDLIIELHDVPEDAQMKMLTRFEKSHNPQIIRFQGRNNVPSYVPAKWREYAREVRPDGQRWVYLTGRNVTDVSR